MKTMRMKSGPKIKKERYETIITLRKKGKPITEIGRILKMTKQGVSYYLRKYGDVDSGKLDK